MKTAPKMYVHRHELQALVKEAFDAAERTGKDSSLHRGFSVTMESDQCEHLHECIESYEVAALARSNRVANKQNHAK